MRIRGKNNLVETQTGSVTRTMGEMMIQDARKKEIAKTTERLKVLEKLEKYREDRMRQEIEHFEMERLREEQELQKHRDAETKRQKYLQK